MSAPDSMAPPPLSRDAGETEPKAGISPETAHDVRSLLQIIVGYAANLRDGVTGPLTAEQVTQATRIVEAADSAAALLSTGGGEAKSVSIEELVREVVSLFEESASSHPVNLVVTCEPNVGLTDQGARVRRVTLNLLSNALKFSPPNGTVYVSVERIVRGDRADRKNAPSSSAITSVPSVRITVADQGPGIPESERSRVLEMGKRLDRDRALPGSGIGLAVVKRGVELSGGTLTIADTVGGGATFVVELPAFAG